MCWRNPGFIREYDGCMHKTDCCQQGYCQEWQPLRNSEYSILIRGGWWDERWIQSSDKWRKRLECFITFSRYLITEGYLERQKHLGVRSWYNSIIFPPLRSQESSAGERGQCYSPDLMDISAECPGQCQSWAWFLIFHSGPWAGGEPRPAVITVRTIFILSANLQEICAYQTN